MSAKRNNCIILMIDAPVPENVAPELRTAFGAERSAHINQDLLQNAYKLAKNFSDAILILSFEPSQRHPDLTWLDIEDPGFLEAKSKNPEGRIADAFRLAFNTGAKKALLLNHLSPKVPSEYLSQTFDSVTDKTIALGPNQDGSVYIVGLTLNNLKLLEGLSFSSPRSAAEITEKAKKNKLSIFSLPESFAVTGEETLRKWLDSRDSDPALFAKPQAGAVETAAQSAANRQHPRRGHKHTHPQPPLPDIGQKPL